MVKITIYILRWRRARVVEGAGLQNQYIIGSNPIDASTFKQPFGCFFFAQMRSQISRIKSSLRTDAANKRINTDCFLLLRALKLNVLLGLCFQYHYFIVNIPSNNATLEPIHHCTVRSVLKMKWSNKQRSKSNKVILHFSTFLFKTATIRLISWWQKRLNNWDMIHSDRTQETKHQTFC